MVWSMKSNSSRMMGDDGKKRMNKEWKDHEMKTRRTSVRIR